MGRIKKARGIKASSLASREKLLENAEILARHPEKLLPVCNNNCKLCIFSPLRERLKSVSAVSDSKSKLRWKMLFGNKIVKAYAGFLTIRFSNSLSVLASVKLPFGTYSFAIRGNAPKEIQLAVQHFDEPLCKALAYLQYAKKGYFFVVADEVYCSGRELKLPEAFKKEIPKITGYKLSEKDGCYTCGHRNPALLIKLNNTRFVLRICSKCASGDINALSRLSSRILGRNVEKAFSLSFEPSFECADNCNSCILEEFYDEEIERDYKERLRSDARSIETFLKKFEHHVENLGIYVIGNRCFGKNAETFASQLSTEEEERRIIILALKKIRRGVFLKESSFAKFLENVWREAGKDIMASIADNEIAERLFNTSQNPVELVRRARAEFEKKKVIEKLPRFKNLKPLGTFVNDIAKEYFIGGKSAAVRAITSRKLQDTKMKAIAYAFLVYFGVDEAYGWQFTKEEKELGRSLASYVGKLLSSRGEAYRNALNDILRYSGSGEEAL